VERYRFIYAEEAHFSVVPMCRLLGVSRSGYYGWRERGDSDRNARTASFDAEVRAAHLKSQMRYGSRRVQRELHEIGLDCSRTRVACAMRRCGLVARARRHFKATTDSNHQLEVAPNLLSRAFHASRPNKAWVGDITYIWTRQGWLYLAVLIDLHARRVVGWAM
jgi:transposase InsO family protein